MNIFFSFRKITQKQRENAIKQIIEESTPDSDFFVVLMLSTGMITLGLLLNDVLVIIGGVIITPLLHPLLGVGLGLAISNAKLLYRSLHTITKSFIYAVITSIIIVFVFGSFGDVGSAEIIARNHPSLLYLFVAVIATTAAIISITKEIGSFVFVSAALSVALLPPIAVVGIGIITFNFTLLQGAFSLFIVNLLGVIFASVLLFSVFSFNRKEELVNPTIKSEDKKVEHTEKVISNIEKKELGT